MDLRPSSRCRSETNVVRAPDLVTADGVRLAAAYDPPPRAAAQGRVGDRPDVVAFVLVHGFTGSWQRPAVRRIARGLSAVGAVLSLDLRGHGGSGGRTSVGDTEVLDVDAAVRRARALGHRRVVTVGFSLGAAVVVRQAGLADPDARPDAVVEVSGPAYWYYRGTAPMRLVHRSTETLGGRLALRYWMGTRLGAPWRQPYPLTPEQAARRLAPTPLLVVHGDADHFFPLEHPAALERSYRAGAAERGVDSRVSCWVRPGMGHAELATDDALVARIAGWATSALRGDPLPTGADEAAAPGSTS